MDGFIKQSTAHTFQMGPFLDDTDGKTAETSLTIAYTSVFVSKNGGAFAAKNDTTDLTGTGDTRGYYDCVLSTTDTNTTGTLKVCAHISGALPVWHTFQVLNAVAYEGVFSDDGDDYLKVDAVQWLGTACATPTTAGVPEVDITYVNGSAYSLTTAQFGANLVNIAGSAVSTTTAQLGVNAVQVNAVATTSVTTVNANIGTTQPVNFTGTGASAYVKADMVDIAGAAVSTSTAQIGVNAVQISGDGTAADNAEAFFDGTGYAGTNNVIPTVTNLTNAPTNGDFTATMKSSITAAVPTAAANADAVWDEASTGHVDAGKAGAQLWTDVDAILEDTGTTLDGKLPAALVGGKIDAHVNDIANDAITAASIADGAGTEIGTAVWATAARTLTAATNITSTGGTTVPQTGDSYAIVNSGTYGNAAIKGYVDDIGVAGAGLTAIPWNASWDAEVQSECWDALNAQAIADSDSPTTDSIVDRLRTLGWILRNKIEVTDANGNTVIYKDDNSTTAFSVAAMLTDNSTTTTRKRAA